MTQKVQNVNGIAAEPNGCRSWLEHWQNVTGEQPGVCAEVKCGKLASEGALVQKAGNHNEAWYVVPLCPKHNAIRGGSLELVGYIPLVPASGEKVGET